MERRILKNLVDLDYNTDPPWFSRRINIVRGEENSTPQKTKATQRLAQDFASAQLRTLIKATQEHHDIILGRLPEKKS